MIFSFSPDTFESSEIPRGLPGYKVQRLLMECEEDSRQLFLQALLNPDLGDNSLERMLKAALKDSDYQPTPSYRSIASWRARSDYWIATL